MTETTETTGWQLVKTAPQGKNLILFAVTDIGPEGQVRNWKMASGWFRFGDGACNWEGSWLKSYDAQPTHWAFMPCPPEIAYDES